jgi:hypothetical protein
MFPASLITSPVSFCWVVEEWDTAEFIAANNLILLRQGMFIGRTVNSDWKGLTSQGPGKYFIRMIYTVQPNGSEVPSNLQFPIFRTQLTSNILEIEVEP